MSVYKRSVPINYYEVMSEQDQWDYFCYGHLSNKKRGWITKKIRCTELKNTEASVLKAIVELVDEYGKGSIKLEEIQSVMAIISLQTIARCIKSLILKGAINKTVLNGRKPNHYALVDF